MQGLAWVRSPAKLNLHLEVQSKRDDGYHSIISIFQMIGLYDEIQCSSLKEKNICKIHGMPDIPTGDNSIQHAVDVFRRTTGITGGVSFNVRKVIPKQAGLGGGSSNAAVSLMLLNEVFCAGLSLKEIQKKSEEIGSDVPFFCNGPCALVTGRGENVRTISPRSGLWCLLVVPDLSIGTSYAYGEYDKWATRNQSIEEKELVHRYTRTKPGNWGFFNSFESVLQAQYPVLIEIKAELIHQGSEYAALSGSGSSCFGIFRQKERAIQGLKAFSGRDERCWVVPLLDKSPCTVLQCK